MREYLKNTLNPLGNCLENRYDIRQGEWKKQRKKYGFDERQTWNLNTTMIELLYERLMMYKEIAAIDLSFHKITIEGEEKTHGEWVDILISLSEIYLNDFYDEENEERIWDIWSKISWSMWW